MCCQGLNMPPSKFRQWNGKVGPEDIRGGALKGSLVKGLLVDEGSSKGPSFISCRLSALLPCEAQPLLSLGCIDFLKVETGFAGFGPCCSPERGTLASRNTGVSFCSFQIASYSFTVAQTKMCAEHLMCRSQLRRGPAMLQPSSSRPPPRAAIKNGSTAPLLL